MNNQGTEKRVWVEPTLTHINAAETLGGVILKNPESGVFTISGATIGPGVSA